MPSPSPIHAPYVSVAVFAPLETPLDYLRPPELMLSPGDLVLVPLGRSQVHGLVTSLHDKPPNFSGLKSVLEKRDKPTLSSENLSFLLWAAQWTMSPPGSFAEMGFSGAMGPRPKPTTTYRLKAEPHAQLALSQAQKRVFEALYQGGLGLTRLCEKAKTSASVINLMHEKGLLERCETDQVLGLGTPDPDFHPAILNEHQQAAFNLIDHALSQAPLRPVLLDGVTGSGKTEVYFELIAKALKDNAKGQILVLLPEIALTQALEDRIEKRFGSKPALWHSQIKPGKRRRLWEGIENADIRLIIGARSALFLPFSQLKMIIIDEEHDGSYKQDDGIRYQARDLALYRAQIAGCPIILASATPSLETYVHARSGKYHWVRISHRHANMPLPKIGMIDLKAHAPAKDRFLTDVLVGAMTETLAQGEQVLLYLNRRGYAPLVLCKACGERLSAPGTDSWLVEHKSTGRLVCHLTGFSMKKPSQCPHCQAKDSLLSVGPGVERIFEEVRQIFPEKKCAIFSSDTTPTPAATEALVARITSKDVDIVIATQAAAKGHNFPHLTLVGVVDADLGLKGTDVRAAERTFQLLAQVSGRAGRSQKPGRALLQAYSPDHPVMQALQVFDRDAFLEQESLMRQAIGFPPFGRLGGLILSSPNQSDLIRFARQLAAHIPSSEGFDVYGPAEAPLAVLRKQHRQRFLIRGNRNRDLQGFIRHWLGLVKKPAAIKITIDIEPYNFT
jgi:primosomal protein N' (replication factor Y) (superfamily II helicase)